MSKSGKHHNTMKEQDGGVVKVASVMNEGCIIIYNSSRIYIQGKADRFPRWDCGDGDRDQRLNFTRLEFQVRRTVHGLEHFQGKQKKQDLSVLISRSTTISRSAVIPHLLRGNVLAGSGNSCFPQQQHRPCHQLQLVVGPIQ